MNTKKDFMKKRDLFTLPTWKINIHSEQFNKLYAISAQTGMIFHDDEKIIDPAMNQYSSAISKLNPL